jgi:superfamily I DNA/RNA helicase
MEFTPSKFQKEIFNFIEKGTGNAVINAKAGAGKTTTIVKAMELIKPNKNVLFIAFNRSIEEELSQKLKQYKNVDVKTFHSLGVSLAKKYIKKNNEMEVNEYKYSLYIDKKYKLYILEELYIGNDYNTT